ncbi:MAG: hypothetical protein V1709_01820 [Planctomycetota bacterium]
MKKIIVALIGLYFLLSNSSIGFAQNSDRWQEARQKFIEKSKSSNPAIRAKVANELGKTIYPAVEYDAANLLVEHIKNEIERGKGYIDLEPQIKYEVLEVCINGLKKITQSKAVEYLVKVALDEKSNWRVRFYVEQSLSEINTPEVIGALVKLIDDANIPIKIATFHALTNLKVPDAKERTCKLLNEDITWEVKINAIRYLDMLNDQELTEPLINAIQDTTLDGYVRFKTVELLRKLTGVDQGLAGRFWLDWWKKKKEEENPTPKKGTEETISIIPTQYYGITVTSTRTIFILDISGSMRDAAGYDESTDPNSKIVITEPSLPKDTDVNSELVNKLKELKKKSDEKQVICRLGAAQKELVNALYGLDPSVEFTMIFFNISPVAWKKTLIKASLENKIDAIDFVMNRVSPLGATCTYDALKLAYKFVGKEQKIDTSKSGYQSSSDGAVKERKVQLVDKCVYINDFGGADTIFMVTDGAPTTGEIIGKEEIVNEIKKISEIRGIVVNTVAIGILPLNPDAIDPYRDVDIKFLAELAASTGGVFRDRTSKTRNKPAKKKE